MSVSSWKKMAEEAELDCTLKRVEIACVLQHVATSGEDFMPFGWCGGCETCATISCPDVCEACSYTDKYDIRQPVYWPCSVEMTKRNQELVEEQARRLAEVRASKQKGFANGG